jgi:hypothetical protein
MSKPILLPGAPTLVLAPGEFAGGLLADLGDILLAMGGRKNVMMRLYRVVPADDMGENIRFLSTGEEQAQAVSSLEAILHNLRLHQVFLEADLSNERDPSLRVIVLADLTDVGSVCLYPLLDKLCPKLAQEPDARLFLLCNIAAFPGEPERETKLARLHLHLAALERHIRRIDCPFQTYLFDGRKEGSVEAKDMDEIGVLMQNFTLALLSGGFAERLSDAYRPADTPENSVVYNSAGASAVIYAPGLLQDLCARGLAEETLATEFLSEISCDPVYLTTALDELLQAAGGLSQWVETLCDATPYRLMPGEAIQLDLHLVDLEFEDLPLLEWGEAIAGYAEYFEKNLLPTHFEMLTHNTEVLKAAVIRELHPHLRRLPSRSDLYPGGLAHGREVIDQCIRSIEGRRDGCIASQTADDAARLEQEYAASMQRLDTAIDDLPDPPRWVKHLPGRLRLYASRLYEFFILRREYAHILSLREHILRALENKLIFHFEQQLRREITDVCGLLISDLETARKEIGDLHRRFETLKDGMIQRAAQSGNEALPFRMVLLDPQLLQWMYSRGQKDPAGIREELLGTRLLDDPQSLFGEDLEERVMAFCRSAYEFLHDYNVEEILMHTGLKDLPILVSLLSRAAVPALRPDFDLGGGNSSFASQYFLCRDPQLSALTTSLDNSSYAWQSLAVNNPYLLISCRVRQMIPAAALAQLFQTARAAFEQLGEPDQKQLRQSFEGQGS